MFIMNYYMIFYVSLLLTIFGVGLLIGGRQNNPLMPVLGAVRYQDLGTGLLGGLAVGVSLSGISRFIHTGMAVGL